MARLRAIWTPLRLVHTSLCFLVVLYAPISWYAASLGLIHKSSSHPVSPNVWLAGFGIASAAMLVAIVIVRAKMMPRRERVGDGRALNLDDEADDAAKRVFVPLRKALVSSWAIADAIGVLGVVVALLVGDGKYYVPFGATALVAMVVLAPRASLLKEVLRAARGG
jgi:hypothetical protein